MTRYEQELTNKDLLDGEDSAKRQQRINFGWDTYVERTYNPRMRTQEELNRDAKRKSYPGEENQYMERRVRLAENEKQRRAEIRESLLAEAYPTPPIIDMAENDRRYHAEGAHTLDRHGATIPLASTNAPNAKNVEGRIHGGAGWSGSTPKTFRWSSDALMNRVVSEHFQKNWMKIRESLALDGIYEVEKQAGPPMTVLGKGFVTNSSGNIVPTNATTYRLVVRLIDGAPPEIMVLTTFPEP
jgi:hypothetical protein